MNKILKEEIEKVSKNRLNRENDSRTGGTGYIEWQFGSLGHIFNCLRKYFFLSWDSFDEGFDRHQVQVVVIYEPLETLAQVVVRVKTHQPFL